MMVKCQQLALDVKLAKPGQPPRKPGDRRGTRDVRFNHKARVDAETHAAVEKAMEKLSAERGEYVNMAEYLRITSELVIGTDENGEVEGRTRVKAPLYRIILRPGEAVLKNSQVPEKGQELLLQTKEGEIPIFDDAILEAAEVLVVEDEYPDGEESEKREGLAPKFSSKEREEILARDGNRCVNCGNTGPLDAHHIEERAKGGETRGANGVTTCRVGCHSLIHGGFVSIEGGDARHARFVDREGRPLDDPAEGLSPELQAALEEAVHAEEITRAEKATRAEEAMRTAWLGDRIPFPIGREIASRVEPQPSGDPEEVLAGLVGQDSRLALLRDQAKGSAALGEPFPHTLFVGPAGTGKTTLARGVAALVGSRLFATSGPFLQDVSSLLEVLGELEAGDVLFVDEVHAVPGAVQEALCEVLDQRRLAFTLLGATTDAAKLPAALKSRFQLRERLGYYEDGELAALLIQQAEARGLELPAESAALLAKHARGTPREALVLLGCVARSAAGQETKTIDVATVERVLANLGYDGSGLKEGERAYLRILDGNGGRASLQRLAHGLGVTPGEVLEETERELVRQGRVRVTRRGRERAPAKIAATCVRDAVGRDQRPAARRNSPPASYSRRRSCTYSR